MSARPKPKSKRKKSSKISKKLLKQFSSLSEGTLHSPSLSLCLELVSKLYLRHITLRDGCVESRRDMEWEEKFDVDNFLQKRYNTYMTYPLLLFGGPIIFKQQLRKSKPVQPTFDTINKFLIGIFKKLHLNVESSIVSLIYTERLMDKRHMSITLRNWRPIVIASILTASKVWDDLSSWNIEFSNLLPILSLSQINKLEGLYLQALQYDLYISSSEYARYYFALRGLKNTNTRNIPRYYLDMKIAKKQKTKMRSSLSASRALNDSLSQRARDFENKSVIDHASNLEFSSANDHSLSLMDEQKYPPIINSNPNNHSLQSDALTSSSDSNKSANSNYSGKSKVIVGDSIMEEEETHDMNNNNNAQLFHDTLQIKRSKALILKPKQMTKTNTNLPMSMPCDLNQIRSVN